MKLNLGSGPHYAPGWLNVDLYAEDADLRVDLFDLAEHLPADTYTQVYMGHVLEHLRWERIPEALSIVRSLMAPGAELVVVGPCIVLAHQTRQPVNIIHAILSDPRGPHDGSDHAWTPTDYLTLHAVRQVFPEARLVPVAEITKPRWPNPSTAPWQCAILAECYLGRVPLTCEVPGCVRPRKYKHLCGTHYERLRRHGSVEKQKPPSRVVPIEERFANHVEWSGGCLLWTGALDKNGYGLTTVDGKQRRAHLVACELVGRPCPPGLVAEHDCHTRDESCPGGVCVHRRCVLPEHVLFIKRAENALLGRGPSMVAYRAGTCQAGHVRTEANTYWRKDRPGKRECKDCARERQLRRRS